jgi:acetyl esterase/lipase
MYTRSSRRTRFHAHHGDVERLNVNNKLRCLLLLCTVSLCGCKTVLFGTVGLLGGHDAQVHADVVFDAQHALQLDVYAPAHAAGAPVVVFFYGGAWINGERRWYRYVGEALSRHGIVVVIPDYRKTKFPTFMDDAVQAVAWTRAHAAEFGGNPRQLFLMGHSAGAHIAALLATDARYLARVAMQPRDLAGFIGLAGPYDFAPFSDDYLLDVFGSDPQAQAAAMPANYVDGDEPPMLLLQGLKDGTVWPRNARSLAEKLQARGEPVETKFYPNLGHLRIALSLSSPFSRGTTTLDDVLDFVARHGAAAGSPK